DLMKSRILVPVAAALCIVGCDQGGGDKAEVTAAPESFEQKYSYALGKDIGGSLGQLPKDIDQQYLFQGVKDGLADEAGLMDDEEKLAVLNEFRTQMQQAQMEKQQAAAGENQAKGEEFRKANAEKEGVKTTESGLQIEVLEEGKGESPNAEDTVTVHYTGTLIDGTEFDSSHKRGQPATFPLNGVIKGWTEGLQLMDVGGKYRLVIPPELAYGPSGAGGQIGPNATLVFEIDLLGIEGGDSVEDQASEDKAE
ncbi:MAG: FKBP-type peptidyl-prolyl cis-trans isomerase, partial [Salinisphaeraceae bacterium]|nr:FKBP-type peptidyl-prolyl cis-trans isomerase [Salinisphaeraceae bacterium]